VFAIMPQLVVRRWSGCHPDWKALR